MKRELGISNARSRLIDHQCTIMQPLPRHIPFLCPPRIVFLLFDNLIIYKAMIQHPMITESLGHIVSDTIRHDHNASLSLLEAFGSFQGTAHRGATTSSTQESFLPDQLAHHDERVLVIAFHPCINQASIAYGWNKIISNALGLIRLQSILIIEAFRLRQNASFGVDANNLNVWVVLFQSFGNTRAVLRRKR